jgi:hypothetical protein
MIYIPNTVPGDVPPYGVGGSGGSNGTGGSGGSNRTGGSGGSNGTDEIGVVGGIGGELVVAPIAKTTANTEVQTTIGEIGGNISPDLFSRQPSNELELDCASQKNHQFTNSSAETIVASEFQAIGDHQDAHQSTHTPPTYDPPGGDRGSPVTPAYNSPSGDDGGELLDAEEMAAWHSRLNACQTLDDAMDFHAALDALSPSQRDQFESSVLEDTWTWLWNLPGLEEPKPSAVPVVSESNLVLEPESVPLSESEPQPTWSEPQSTVSELKALLLACDSLVQLNKLKRKHRQTIAKAYDSMSEKEQAHVDALAALAVPYKVFKYLGEEIQLGTERLLSGMLVYIDPQAQVRATASSVPVWAINGVSVGWKRAINVSLSVLQEVVKVVCKSQNQDGGQQMDLI